MYGGEGLYDQPIPLNVYKFLSFLNGQLKKFTRCNLYHFFSMIDLNPHSLHCSHPHSPGPVTRSHTHKTRGRIAMSSEPMFLKHSGYICS